VLPRNAFFADYDTIRSVYLLAGEPWAVALLFAVAGAVAIALTVGYRTRLATVISWGLLLSLQTRHPMVLNSGDSLLLMLLFWSAFLPLGVRWSVDAVRRADPLDGSVSADGAAAVHQGDSAVTTVATMALLMQMLVMYLTNAVHKLEGDLWMSGEAIVYVMQADQFTYLLGNPLADFHGLLRVLTIAWVALLFASPLLLLSTGFPRAAIAFHVRRDAPRNGGHDADRSLPHRRRRRLHPVLPDAGLEYRRARRRPSRRAGSTRALALPTRRRWARHRLA
jgi:hypothetical protein